MPMKVFYTVEELLECEDVPVGPHQIRSQIQYVRRGVIPSNYRPDAWELLKGSLRKVGGLVLINRNEYLRFIDHCWIAKPCVNPNDEDSSC